MNYSIIIPHRNIPDLLMRCLASIPVRGDVQVIVVDDNSDNADRYLEQYPELSRPNLEFVRTTSGKGAGYARNVGLDHAKGKWLIFADADDFFTDEFESLLDENVNAKEDIVFFPSLWVMSEDITKPSPVNNWINPMIERYFASGDEMEIRCRIPNPWGKFYKREFIESHSFRFHETRCANDMFFVISACVSSPAVKVVNTPIYYYTFRSDSLSRRSLEEKGELEVRLIEGLQIQQVVLSSKYKSKNLPGMGFLSIAFHQNRPLFNKYFGAALDTGLSPLQAMAELRYREKTLINKIWVYMCCFYLFLKGKNKKGYHE